MAEVGELVEDGEVGGVFVVGDHIGAGDLGVGVLAVEQARAFDVGVVDVEFFRVGDGDAVVQSPGEEDEQEHDDDGGCQGYFTGHIFSYFVNKIGTWMARMGRIIFVCGCEGV